MPPLRDVIAACGLAPRKALGQNFLFDLNLTRKIARAAGPLDVVLEIGPGPGGLTRALLMEGAARVVAVERDARCAPALEAIAARWPGRLQVIEADALSADADARVAAALAGAGAVKIVANLPYNIGTELVVRWLRAGGDAGWPSWWRSATVMLQREVAERLCAPPGAPAFGRLSVLAAFRCAARIAFDVPPQAFHPAPKVTSSIVSLTPLADPPARCPLEALEAVTAAAFSQRRKMLRSALKTLRGPDGAATPPLEVLERAGVEPTLRGEALGLEAFAALARAYAEMAAPARGG